jgi:DNA repair protein RadC
VLFRSIPRRDVKPIAKELICSYGPFAEVVAAPQHLLTEVPGVGEAVAADLRIVAAAGQRLARGQVTKRAMPGSWRAVIDECRAAMAFEAREQFRILFLDKKNALIADEVQQVGTVDHPTGDPTPSQADSTMTRKIIAVAKAMGIVVHGHIIVGRDGHARFKGYRLM